MFIDSCIILALVLLAWGLAMVSFFLNRRLVRLETENRGLQDRLTQLDLAMRDTPCEVCGCLDKVASACPDCATTALDCKQCGNTILPCICQTDNLSYDIDRLPSSSSQAPEDYDAPEEIVVERRAS